MQDRDTIGLMVLAKMSIEVRHSGENQVVAARTARGLSLAFDADGGTAPSPMEHLLASAGACALMDVAHILRKKRLAFRNLRVECEGDRPDEGHPKPFRSLRLSFRVEGDVPLNAFEQAVRLSMEKYCNVAATLRSNPAVDFEAKVEAPQG